MTFNLDRNCIIGYVRFHCCGHSIAVPIGSCCNVSVSNLENHGDFGYFRDTESWCHALMTSFGVRIQTRLVRVYGFNTAVVKCADACVSGVD